MINYDAVAYGVYGHVTGLSNTVGVLDAGPLISVEVSGHDHLKPDHSVSLMNMLYCLFLSLSLSFSLSLSLSVSVFI